MALKVLSTYLVYLLNKGWNRAVTGGLRGGIENINVGIP